MPHHGFHAFRILKQQILPQRPNYDQQVIQNTTKARGTIVYAWHDPQATADVR